jgi:glycosyltransferase involved in cell wall biosynthesis
MEPGVDRPLRIALLAYRGKPHVGGQGVYTRHLSKALTDLGHHVEVLGGQPFPVLDPRVPLVELPSLDIYNDHFPMRMPGIWELKHWPDFVEVTAFSAGTFPEPLAFSLRAWDHLRHRKGEFDLVHDNQSLGYGLLAIQRDFPLLGTIHHPITVDRRLELEHAEGRYKRLTLRRWYAFTKMQTRVAKRLHRMITVSESSFNDIVKDHGVAPERLHIVPVGVDEESFRPLPHIRPIPGRLVTTASADVTMKGLKYLLEAVAKLRTERPEVHLVVIGRRIVELYAEAELAVVPSLYEGFSLPAIEAMSCGIPLVATTGGALPEVVGTDGDTALTVEPGDSEALAAKLRWALECGDELRATVGQRGRQRIIDRWSWRITAAHTLEQYRALLAEERR